MKTKAYMCRYDMNQQTQDGIKHAKGPRDFFTNSPHIAGEVNLVCEGDREHVIL